MMVASVKTEVRCPENTEVRCPLFSAAAEVEQLGGGGVHGEESHRLLHDPSGELDRMALDRPTQELGPAHCADAHGLASNQPLAQPETGSPVALADLDARMAYSPAIRGSLTRRRRARTRPLGWGTR
jgi:hypothetical protein